MKLAYILNCCLIYILYLYISQTPGRLFAHTRVSLGLSACHIHRVTNFLAKKLLPVQTGLVAKSITSPEMFRYSTAASCTCALLAVHAQLRIVDNMAAAHV